MLGRAITRYLLIGLAVATVALGCIAKAQHSRATRLFDDLALASQRIAGYEAAAAVHRAHIQRLERITADAVVLDREFQSGEGADAPLDDYLRDGAGKLWR